MRTMKTMKTMKTILLFTAITTATVMTGSNQAEAGMFSALRSSGWDTKTTEHYKLNVMNFDVRVYEFTPKHNKDVRCVFVAGNENSSGVACYNIKTKGK